MGSATSRAAAASNNKADEEVVDVEAAIVAAGREDFRKFGQSSNVFFH